jgi:hypothetical protein
VREDPAPAPSSTMSPGLSDPYLLGYPNSSSQPINWKWVENEAESACSQVAATGWLLHDALTSVHHNMLRPFKLV